MFEEFQEIDVNNEDMFEFMAYTLVIQFLEKVCLKIEEDISEAASSEERYKNVKWDTALEFPENLASMGRSKLHEVANFFNLAHHSRGPKNKTGGKKHRWFLLYPKTLFTDKQELERTRLLKERDDIRDKFKSKDCFSGIPPENP